MNYNEKNKVDKHVKAETHVLDTLSIAPDITIVNESVSVEKKSPSKIIHLCCILCHYTCENSTDLKMHSKTKCPRILVRILEMK